MNLLALRQSDPPVLALVVEHGREAVIDEMLEMCSSGAADIAMSAALKIDEGRTARICANAILNGAYPEQAKSDARELLGQKMAS